MVHAVATLDATLVAQGLQNLPRIFLVLLAIQDPLDTSCSLLVGTIIKVVIWCQTVRRVVLWYMLSPSWMQCWLLKVIKTLSTFF